jgi:hypothetical protein
MNSLALFDIAPPAAQQPAIFGESFSPEQDGARLSGQRACVAHLMSDGQWRTLPKIARDLVKQYSLRASETSISARLRDMRRGGWKIERQRTAPASGLWSYRAIKEEAAA